MLKKRELHDAPVLYDLMIHPEVFPYIRQKAYSLDEFYFLTKSTIEAEGNGQLISRTIVDEYLNPIGTINLFDIKNKTGFLATWIGKPYFGKGYNKIAKDAFFEELFFIQDIEAIFIKIRKTNIRSLKAIVKLPFVSIGDVLYPEVFQTINKETIEEPIYHLFVITKDQYILHKEHVAQSDEEVVV